MAVDISVRATSLQLYDFLCQHIVGTEETVRTKRLITTIADNLDDDDFNAVATITSGSSGEGISLKGSDLDIMYVCKSFVVHEDTKNVKIVPEKMNLVMDINDTKIGFTQLRLLNDFTEVVAKCTKLFEDRGNSWYLSSEMSKLLMMNSYLSHIHGPCVSDINERLDLAICLHNPHWIKAAGNWISRGHASWPSSDVKSEVIAHGVLYVPIGSKGSANEALEWRISFSVAEKLLIYSFSHTQLLCYALLKILLKDLINSNINCKNLLCSYFIKTIIFWVSEEIPVTEWKPENLAQCFMRCFRRLLYCVEFSMCPHYFIPINNLFEDKIEKQPRQLLLGHLNTLLTFGWRCVLFSEQLQNFIHSNALAGLSELKGTQLSIILKSYTPNYCGQFRDYNQIGYRNSIRILTVHKSSVIKLTCLRNMSYICSQIPQTIIVSPYDTHKLIYSQRRTQLAYLLQNIHHDAASGWIMLAAFFYKIKQYRNALYVLSYVSYALKCSDKKLINYLEHPSQPQRNLTKSTTLQKRELLRALNLGFMGNIFLVRGSTFMPKELVLNLGDHIFHQYAFYQFLSFLCHYHLNDKEQCFKSIKNMLMMIDEQFDLSSNQKELNYIVLSVAIQKHFMT